jgi:glycosyltransferase involved in cell wall biosynthesis
VLTGNATRDPASRPHKLGLFLGVAPTAGGMFQYAQSMLEAVASVDSSRFEVIVAFDPVHWSAIMGRLGLTGYSLRRNRSGRVVADLVMALRIPEPTSKVMAQLVNPLVKELLALDRETWLFPAQESITYQVPAVQVVGTVHDLMHRYEPQFPEAGSRLRRWVRDHRFKNIVRASCAVLVDSTVGQRHVIESYEAAPANVHPLPYAVPRYVTDASERADFEQAYRLPRRFLFYPAQFWSHKNHIRLIEALRIASESHPDIHLVLSGSKRHRYDDIRDAVERLKLADRVHFVGYVPDADLGGFYRRARALVMPTFFGPTNIPPIEAQALGCPALVSDIYAMREQLGDAALYFDPHSVRQIADCIAQVWADDLLAGELSRKGLARSGEHTQQQFNTRLARLLDEHVVSDSVQGLDKN